MFGPGISIHERDRIHRRRLIGGGSIGATLFAIAAIFGRWEVTAPPHLGLPGPLVLVPDVDEPASILAEVPTEAGGHPIPRAIAAVLIEELNPEVVPKPPTALAEPVAATTGPDELNVPETPPDDPGPAVGEGHQAETARPQVSTTNDVVILKFVRPHYPSDARLLGNEGRVLIRARVDTNGNVAEVQAEPEEGLMPSCVVAATKAVRQWRFKPLISGGVPETAWVDIWLNFKLRGVSASDPQRS